MNRRRMMMGDAGYVVTLKFTGANSNTKVTYNGQDFTEGRFFAKKGETINCVCYSNPPYDLAEIKLDGAVVKRSLSRAEYSIEVMNDILIEVNNVFMDIYNKKRGV